MSDAALGPPDPDRWDDPDSLEAGRKLFAKPATFLRGVAQLEQLPPAGLPEVAFAGRSNVGKSTLINAISRRRAAIRRGGPVAHRSWYNIRLWGHGGS